MKVVKYTAAFGCNHTTNVARPYVVVVEYENGQKLEKLGQFATMAAAQKKAAKLNKAL
jgi:hypothetical protein